MLAQCSPGPSRTSPDRGTRRRLCPPTHEVRDGYHGAVHHRGRVACVTVAIAALAVACGGGGDDTGSSSGTTTTKAATTTAGGTTGASGSGRSGASGASAAAGTTTVAVTPTVFTTTPAAAVPGPVTLTEASAVTTAGLGPLTFGLTVAAAEKAIGTRLLPDTAFAAGGQCIVLKPEKGPDAVWFTVTKGTVERLDVRPPSKLKTRSGAGVASTEAQLKSLFAEKLVVAAVGPAKRATYTPTDAANADFRIIFELDAAGAVTSFRAGRVGSVESVTPCA
jgi:hypothetical protein